MPNIKVKKHLSLNLLIRLNRWIKIIYVMNEGIDIKILGDYKIRIKFSDGTDKVINFRKFLNNGITRELLDYKLFLKAKIEPGGGIAWPNGYDFCPNYLREL